jgi:transposase
MQGKKQLNEKLFVSFQLSERVPEDNFYRKLKGILDFQWLYKKTAKYYGSEGQESIDPVVFFKLILIGYLENIASDRRIINMASMRLDMLFFIGYDIDEPLPWHSTLSRTRQLYGQEVFIELFKDVLKQCIDKGMVAGRRQAIDSVFVKANASLDSLAKKQILEDVDVYSKELQEQDNWKELPKHISNEEYHSTTDPDARISTKPGKPRQFNYLSQVSVDTAHHVITNIEAHHSDKTDSQCLAEVVDNTIENITEQGLEVEEVICDGSYSSPEALQHLEDIDITGYIPDRGQYIAEREDFVYNKEEDYYLCRQGKKLTYQNTYKDGKGYPKKHYRSKRGDCKGCPFRLQCLGKSGKYKKLADTVDKPLYDRMHIRTHTARGRLMRKLRQSTVEPVIGTLVCYGGMRKVNTIGMVQANKCMLMAAVAYNLKKLLKWQTRKLEVCLKSMGIKAKTASYCLYQLLGIVINQLRLSDVFTNINQSNCKSLNIQYCSSNF